MTNDPQIDDFWSARTVLTHIHQFARARRRCPWAVLGVAIIRANGIIPPAVGLPPHVGGRASLNTFVALTGPSGAGKGTSESAARDAIMFRWHHGAVADLPEFPIGSGEGLARVFMPPPKGKDGDAEREQIFTAIFSVPEVDTAAGLFSRSGSTLESELRKVFSGEQLGFTNAHAQTRTRVPAHTYRCGLIVGVQPGRAGALLDGADGGTPQRFVWLPVLDADMPDECPAEPAPVTVDQPVFRGDLTVPDVARAAIDAHQLAMHRGEVDPLDGHRLLVRLKVAAALMVLDNRKETPAITNEDWQLAGTIMAVSDHTRAWVQRERAEAARRINRGRALATADRDEIISDRKLQRAKQAILRWLARVGEMPARELLPRLKADIRDYFEPATAELADEGQILVTEVPNGKRFRLNDAGTAVPPVQPLKSQVKGAVPEYTAVPACDASIPDSCSSTEIGRPRMSGAKWFNSRIAELQNAGNTTAQSFAVYQEGRALGYTRATLAQAASNHPDIVVIARTNKGATWSITGDQQRAYKTAPEFAQEYVAALPANATTVDQFDFRQRAKAAGYDEETACRAAIRHPRIESVPAPGRPYGTTDRIWKLTPQEQP